MTLALSNFMRQAAREDIVAYSICSAVLEGTTVDRGAYNPYYETCAKLYDLPQESIAPIYAHLDLDVQYQHSDLFLDILSTIESMPAARAGRGARVRAPAGRAHLALDRQHREVLRQRGKPDAPSGVQQVARLD